jgi:hypothetical protein
MHFIKLPSEKLKEDLEFFVRKRNVILFKILFLDAGRRLFYRSPNIYVSKKNPCQCIIYRHTFSSHANFEALLESTVLTLVAVVLVDRAAAASSTRIGEIAAHGSLEEALASFTGELAVVFTTGLVTAHDTLHTRLFITVTASTATCNNSDRLHRH